MSLRRDVSHDSLIASCAHGICISVSVARAKGEYGVQHCAPNAVRNIEWICGRLKVHPPRIHLSKVDVVKSTRGDA